MEHESSVGAIVLAGGRSTRLGRDKASELLLGRPLLQHVVDRVGEVASEIVVVAAPGQMLPAVEAAVPMTVAIDAYPGSGPLGGIYTGLVAARAAFSIAVACDMPLLSPTLLAALVARATGVDVVMPVLTYPEPLHAVYGRGCIEPIRERLESGQLKITNFLGAVRVRYVREDECRAVDRELRSFLNVNTEEDLAHVRTILEHERG